MNCTLPSSLIHFLYLDCSDHTLTSASSSSPSSSNNESRMNGRVIALLFVILIACAFLSITICLLTQTHTQIAATPIEDTYTVSEEAISNNPHIPSSHKVYSSSSSSISPFSEYWASSSLHLTILSLSSVQSFILCSLTESSVAFIFLIGFLSFRGC